MQGGVGAAVGGAGAAAAGPTPQQTEAMHYIDHLWGDPGGAALGDDGKRVLEDLFGAWFWKKIRSQAPLWTLRSVQPPICALLGCMPPHFLLRRS